MCLLRPLPAAPLPGMSTSRSTPHITIVCLRFYEWVSSTVCPISFNTEQHYCADLQYLFPDLNLNATEHFEYIAPLEKDCKLVNSIEEWVLYNVLNGNCIELFLYLTHSIKTFCNIILQSACGFKCEIQCCDILIKWISFSANTVLIKLFVCSTELISPLISLLKA